ncbi:MAG: diguanylate cyclase [Cyanobacteria bacterium P01_F01_bin.13]
MLSASEQSNSPFTTSAFLDSRSSHAALSQALLELSHYESIQNGDLAAAAAAVTYSVVKNLGTTSCQTWLYTDDRSKFEAVAHYGAIASEHPNQTVPVINHPNYFQQLSQRGWLVINTGEALSSQTNDHLDHSQASENWPPYLLDQEQTITALIEIPIYYQNQIVGVLCCDHHHSPRVWQAAETTFMVMAANLISLAISQANYQQQARTLKKQKRQLTLEMIERQQAEQAWQEGQRFIQGMLDASTNILYVNDFASGTNYYVNGYMKTILGYSPEEIQQLGAQFLEQIAYTQKDIKAIHQARQQLAQSKSGDIVENEYRLQHKHGDWHWLLCRETIFQWNQDGTPLQLLGTATDITAHKEDAEVLQQQNQQLTALAMVDGLTQIANRRAFDEFLSNAWAARNHIPLTLILCDIDYFKLYNDTYGHQKGDECIKLVAQALQQSVKRQRDLVARYGGEEFAIVLPNTSLTGAKHVAQAIQTTVGELKIEHRLSTISNYLTISLGIATVASTVHGSPQELIAAADRGLYQAKSDGRARFSIGRIESYEN